MGRHARLADREELFKAFEETDEQIQPALLPPKKRRFRWVARVPLLPAVAGVVALGVVLAAYGTQQISLNFSDGKGPPHADKAQLPTKRPDAAAQGNRASRGSPRASAVNVAFHATSKWADGFEGSATIVNVSGRPITGWTFAFRIPNAKVLSIWEAQVSKLGSPVVVRNPPQSPTIAPGEVVRLGFTARGAAGTPSACLFNGVRCHIV
ncbi:MAG TPA: cellulose binding domain-containing protein [Streptosporangiaceae bacterium]|jgi:hypothetical protein